MLWWVPLAFAGPEVVVEWKGSTSALRITAPEGTKISPDAPADLTLTVDDRLRTYGIEGRLVLEGLPLGDLRGASVDGSIALQLCETDTGICTPETFRFDGAVPESRKGAVTLDAVALPPPTEAPVSSPFNQDAGPVADAAFARAKADGELVLLDFSAVWCPPCNLLAAEVLHADDHETTLEGFALAVIDVDHASSWALKDRYEVGGYPTLIVADVDGNELSRMVGYPGREAFLDFLADASTPARNWAEEDPASLSADEAARGFLALLDTDIDLVPWARAAEASGSLEAHVARFRHGPNGEDLTWLVEHHPETVLDWLPHAGDWAEQEGREPLLHALPKLVAAVEPVPAVDVLWCGAQIAEGSEQTALYAAGATILRAAQTGDLERDRGNIEFLAELLARSGEGDRAIALLDRTARDLPDDPTFLLAGARHLNDEGSYAEALRRAERAMPMAWGDLRLRVAHAQCTALMGLGRQEEAASLARQTLTDVPAPPEALKVRAHRYREKLSSFVE